MSEENVYKKAGEILAEARKARGVSLDEVSEITKIRKVLLEAIEESNYAELPEIVYSCGFVRSYAKLFGLDYASLSEQFKAESASAISSVPIRTVLEPEDEAESSLPDKKTVIAVLFVAVLLYAAWAFYGMYKEKAANAEAESIVEPVSESEYVEEVVAYDAVADAGEQSEPKVMPVINVSSDSVISSALEGGLDSSVGSNSLVAVGDAGERVLSDSSVETSLNDIAPGLSSAAEAVSRRERSRISEPQVNIKEESFVEEEPVAVDEPEVKADAALPAAYGKKEGSRVTLEAEKEVWVQIENGNGKILLSRILAKGDKYYVPDGDNTLRLRAGKAAILVYVDGKKVAPLSKGDAILKNVSIDADSLLAREM